jgi:hypothetical protein
MGITLLLCAVLAPNADINVLTTFACHDVSTARQITGRINVIIQRTIAINPVVLLLTGRESKPGVRALEDVVTVCPKRAYT